MIAESYEAFDRECERLEALARAEVRGPYVDEDNDSTTIDLGERYRENREID